MNQIAMGAISNDKALSYNFSIQEVLKESWQRVQGIKAPVWGALGYIFLVAIVFFIVQIVVASMFPQSKEVSSGLIQFISSVVTFPLSIGLQYLGIRRAVDLPVRAKQIFSMYQFFGRIIGLFILQTFILTIFMILTAIMWMAVAGLDVSGTTRGLLYLIPVGFGFVTLYIAMTFFFAYLVLVEKRLGIWASYKASFHAFNQHWFKIIVIFFMMIFIYILGLALFIVGLIWAIPMIVNINGILYRIAFGVEEARVKVVASV